MRRCAALLLSLTLLGFSQAQLPKDIKSELPRIPPRSPADAVKSFRLRPGFRIELVAAEPHVQSPVALDFDEHGKMYVTEFPEYNQYANKAYKGKGVVRLLEDVDGDGRYDKSTVFLDNLDAPVAVTCWEGGVFVGSVPDLWYCKDTDGDGKADVRRRVLSGFARDPAGEAMLNSFRWGFDNRIHISTNLAGGTIKRPDDKDVRPISIKGQNLVFDPRTGDFNLTSGGGQHGMSMDDWGTTFVCSNSDPMSVLMYDGRYLQRNPYLQAPAAAVRLLPEGGKTRIFRASGIEPWRALRTRLRKEKLVPGSDEGGQPAGFFTGATGVTVYRGHAWPSEYRGQLFVGEVSGNLVFRARVKQQGLGWIGERADPDVEFLASEDNWFRPVQFAHGPDGNLYVIDMYRELIEGAAFLPPLILQHMDVSAGIDKGRIWRIVADKESAAPARVLPGKATLGELVALLEHANGWHRDTASRLLYQRQDARAVPLLEELLKRTASPLGKLHVLHALQGQNALTPAQLATALADAEPRLRAQALRLAERFSSSPEIREKTAAMTADPDARVRYQLAFTLGAFPGAKSTAALAELARKDAADPWMRLAILTSAHPGAGDLLAKLLADQTTRTSSGGKILLATLAQQIGAANRKDDLARLVQAIDALPAAEKSLREDLVRSLASKQPSAARDLLQGTQTGAILAKMVDAARRDAVNDKADVPARVEAIRTLGLAPFAEVSPLFANLLQLRQPQAVQSAALETLGRFAQPEVASLVLAAWPQLSPQIRATAAETLFSRPEWIASLLDAIEKDHVKRGEIDPARIALLQAHPNAALKTRAARVLVGNQLARRQEVVAAYQKSLTLEGDMSRGKALFKKTCASCHRLEGIGNHLGADLNAIRNRGLEAMLLNILDPNREVLPQFVSYLVVTSSGRTLTGMIAAETATNITLHRPDGTSETILRRDIDELRSTGLSFMPEGLEKTLDTQAMADLLAYLNAIR